MRQINERCKIELQRWALIDHYTALTYDLLCIPYPDLAPSSLILLMKCSVSFRSLFLVLWLHGMDSQVVKL